MAILTLITVDGSAIAVGPDTVPVGLPGLVAVERVLCGEDPEVEALAAGDDAVRASLLRLVHLIEDAGPGSPVPAAPPALLVAATAPPRTEFDPDRELLLLSPYPLLADHRGFTAWRVGEPGGVVLDAHEAAALASFARPAAASSLAIDPANRVLADSSVRDATVARWCELGLVGAPDAAAYRTNWERKRTTTRGSHDRARALLRQQEELLDSRPPRNGRVPVFGAERGPTMGPPLALGMIFAAAEAYQDGALVERYDFVPDWRLRPGAVRRAVAGGPAVFLFSNYVWSADENHVLSNLVKELSPRSVVVHGGPSAPRYPGDREQYFIDHPAVDVIVHGEGEVTAVELLAALDGELTGDLSVLAGVPGITFRPRPGAEPITTDDRARITDLNTLPSPYLAGVFDAWKHTTVLATMETNRGCPYGCTFCDWGAATNSRIRQFDLQRVFDEIEWLAAARVPNVIVADANFGIFERDIAITEHIAAVKARTGFPHRLATNFAKNTVKHLESIVGILCDADLDVNGVMSVQSFDPEVLTITRRKNLKSSEYERLAVQFRAKQMPMVSDIMLGLPGATVASTRSDLQQIVEHEVNASIYGTALLPNSPMNEPSYREEWEIVVDEHANLVSTASYTAEDRAEMDRMVAAFHAAETYGILRVALRWLAVRLDESETGLLDDVRLRAAEEPAAYPTLAYVLCRFLEATNPPAPWWVLVDELARFAADRWGVPADEPAWKAVRTLQLHVLPDHGRSFPETVELDLDVVSWLRDRVAARDAGAPAPVLEGYGPAAIEVSDPHQTCLQLGKPRELMGQHSFELSWPGARHVVHRTEPA